MAYKNLREFIADLERKGNLRRIKGEVDPELEITEITDRVTKAGGPALFFERIRGSSLPLAINLFGTWERMSMALGVKSPDEIAQRIRSFIPRQAPAGIFEKLSFLPKLIDLGKSTPVRVKNAPCQEIIDHNPSLSKLPVMKCWPQDAGRYITFPGVVTKDAETGSYNLGAYRMQVYDERTTGMHWQIHKDGAHHWHQYKKLKKRMEVAVVLGGDPVTMYSGTAPLPRNVGDEYTFAGFIRREPVALVKCATLNLEVPAEAEIILEGYVDPEETRVEGPFGDHTGFYSAPEPYPVFHLTCITHRKDAIYPSIIVGKPPQEDAFLGKATERIFLPLIQTQLPEIVDMNLPVEGAFHNCVIVSIQKSYPGHAKKVMHALWGLGLLSLTKVVIVVEAQDCNVQDLTEVTWKVFGNIDPKRDVIFSEGPVDALDYSSCSGYVGSKMGIDATRKTREEGMLREWPAEAKMSEEIKNLVTGRWREYGFF